MVCLDCGGESRICGLVPGGRGGRSSIWYGSTGGHRRGRLSFWDGCGHERRIPRAWTLVVCQWLPALCLGLLLLRDIHAATQHIATAPQQYESAGRMLVGLQPLNPMILV